MSRQQQIVFEESVPYEWDLTIDGRAADLALPRGEFEDALRRARVREGVSVVIRSLDRPEKTVTWRRGSL